MTRQAHGRIGRRAAAVIAVVAMTVPLAGTANAAERDRHASAQTEVMVKALSGRLVDAHHDVTWAGGRVVSGHLIANGFFAQVPVTAVTDLRHAPGIAAVVVIGPAIVE